MSSERLILSLRQLSLVKSGHLDYMRELYQGINQASRFSLPQGKTLQLYTIGFWSDEVIHVEWSSGDKDTLTQFYTIGLVDVCSESDVK